MLPGNFIGGEVRQLETFGVVNGVRREIVSFDAEADISHAMPNQVSAAGGISARSGKIVWAQSSSVESDGVSPWHKPASWPPSAGDKVQVYTTDGVTSYPRFTGVIDKTSGDVGGDYTSDVIDQRDKFNVLFSHPALLRHHVPYAEDGDYRSIGLSHWYLLAAALRKARIFNTPPAVAEIAVSVPLQGSVWPESGDLVDARGINPGTHAAFRQSPWGFVGAGFTATYRPRISPTLSQPLLIGIMFPPDASTSDRPEVSVNYGSTIVRLRMVGKTAYGMLGGVTVVTLSGASIGNSNIVSLLVKNGSWTLSSGNGATVSAEMATPGTSSMSLVTVTATYSSTSALAGVQVSCPATVAHETAYNKHVPNLRIVPGGLATTMDMSPRLENRNVADLVAEICEATLTAAWWDELGVLQLVSSDRLSAAEVAQTVTTLDDITQMGWEDSLLSVRSKVEVSWKSPSISKGRQQRKELYRGSGDSMVSGDVIEVLAQPDDDTEWFGVDRNLRILNSSNWSLFNTKRGSFAGYYFSSSGETVSDTGLNIDVKTTPHGVSGLKVKHAAGTFPSDVEANLSTSPTASTLWATLRNQNLPVVRGFGEGKWVDSTHVSEILGPADAPALQHELGPWGQEYVDGDSVARRLADFIARQVSAPNPTLSGIRVLYDPRRQVGDVVSIAAGILDVTFRALIVGLSESCTVGEHSQTLAVRIISFDSSRRVKYSELESAWHGKDYSALEAVWSGLTYKQFEDEPLRKE